MTQKIKQTVEISQDFHMEKSELEKIVHNLRDQLSEDRKRFVGLAAVPLATIGAISLTSFAVGAFFNYVISDDLESRAIWIGLGSLITLGIGATAAVVAIPSYLNKIEKAYNNLENTKQGYAIWKETLLNYNKKK